MENFETPMLSGTPVAVNASPISGAETEMVEDQKFSEGGSIEVSGDFESLDHTNEDMIADQILASAKDEGFDKTLEALADGEFEKDTNEPHGEDQLSEEASEGEVLEDPEVEIELENEVDPEKAALYQEIEGLKSQVNDLSERNTKLSQRLERAESINELSMRTMLEMLKLMQRLAEKEEDEEKIDFWELMVELVARFMESIILGDIAEGEKKEVKKGATKPSKKSFDNKEILDISRKVQEKNDAMSQENIEMPAA